MNNEKYNQIIEAAYNNYVSTIEPTVEFDGNKPILKEEFINKCKYDQEFSEKWGLKIETKVLSWEKRADVAKEILAPEVYYGTKDENGYSYGFGDISPFTKPIIHHWLNHHNVPNRKSVLTYKNEMVESYEYKESEKPLNIGVIGQGFVGSAVREGMKERFGIFAYDKDPEKFSNTSSILQVVENSSVIFLCVPTPMKKSGECDLKILRSALGDISECVKKTENSEHVVVIKSTIPPGSTKMLGEEFTNLKLVFNPEFLTEANAVEDYKNQNRIILGGEDYKSLTDVHTVFRVTFPKVPIITTSSIVAETIKYVTNTFLSMKVSYANEIFQICKALNIDYDEVINYAKLDERLGESHWKVPGPDGDFGYGGHCFPKDISALIYAAKNMGVDVTMLEATVQKNNMVRTDLNWLRQKGRAVSEE